MSQVTAKEWKAFLQDNPNSHLLQTTEWGALKENFNWKVIHVISGTIGAQILFRQLLPGIKLAYIPKGPIGVNWENTKLETPSWNEFVKEIDTICHEEYAFLLKIEPDFWEIVEKTNIDGDTVIHKQTLNLPDGFVESIHSIQPQRSMIVDLSIDEDTILAKMKQKTRYNIRLARRKNIVIHPSADVNGFFKLMQETGARDQFFIHDQTYYKMAYDLFHPYGYCELLQADIQDTAIAGLMIFAFGNRSWYLFGASSNLHRERMPSYLLQWEAMLWAKSKGCTEYDLWGVPDEGSKFLEEQFTERSDGLWGVYRFKRGFGGELRRAPEPWDRVYNPLLYRIYNWWMRRRNQLQ